MLISVVIAEDHNVTRQGLEQILEARLEARIVGSTGSGSEVVPLIEKHGPDLLILDLGLPDVDGLTILKQLENVDTDTRIVVLSMQDEDVYVQQALQHGASAYVLKGSPIKELIDAIRAVMDGKQYLSDELPTSFLNTDDDSTAGPKNRYSTLTPREREVLRLIARGMTSQEIGDHLDISSRTVDKHRQNLKAKLQLRNSVELTRFFLKRRRSAEDSESKSP